LTVITFTIQGALWRGGETIQRAFNVPVGNIVNSNSPFDHHKRWDTYLFENYSFLYTY